MNEVGGSKEDAWKWDGNDNLRNKTWSDEKFDSLQDCMDYWRIYGKFVTILYELLAQIVNNGVARQNYTRGDEIRHRRI